MRVFSGGYRKTEYDRAQDRAAAKHAADVAAAHRAAIKAIDDAATARIDAELKAAFEKLNALKARR